MPKFLRLMHSHKLMGPEDDGGSGGGGGEDAAAIAAAAAAATAAADAAAAAAAGKPTKPSDEEAKLLRDLMKHKGKAQEAEAELAKVRDALKQFEGLDPAKIRALLAEQDDLETKKLEAKGDYDRLVRQMAERHATEKSQLQLLVDASSQTTVGLQRQISDLTVGGAFSQSKFVQDDLTLTPSKARVIYGSHFEFKDGQVIGFDKPAGASERTMLVDASGSPLPFDVALLKIVEADADKDHLLRSKVKPGASSLPSAKGIKKVDAPKLSSLDRIAAGLKTLAK
jgi:hypothetical protein